jgi:DNA-binding transcriptional LysR family regulator
MSQHICRHELESGELALLPVTGNPIEREWFVIHLAARNLTPVAVAFEKFLVEHGQKPPRLSARIPFPIRNKVLI